MSHSKIEINWFRANPDTYNSKSELEQRVKLFMLIFTLNWIIAIFKVFQFSGIGKLENWNMSNKIKVK